MSEYYVLLSVTKNIHTTQSQFYQQLLHMQQRMTVVGLITTCLIDKTANHITIATTYNPSFWMLPATQGRLPFIVV